TRAARSSSAPCASGTPEAGAIDQLRAARARSGGAHLVATRFLVELELDEVAGLRFLEQAVERAESVVALGEARIATLERLLDHRAPDLLFRAALGEQGLVGVDHQVHRLL